MADYCKLFSQKIIKNFMKLIIEKKDQIIAHAHAWYQLYNMLRHGIEGASLHDTHQYVYLNFKFF